MVEKGLSIVFVSSELEEVTGISDRILVLNRGLVAAELTGEEGFTPARILSHVLQVEEMQ
jgi:rhamnose transport system ATP-binding protein